MIYKDWNYGSDWWLLPSVIIRKSPNILEIGFRFLKFEVNYIKITRHPELQVIKEDEEN